MKRGAVLLMLVFSGALATRPALFSNEIAGEKTAKTASNTRARSARFLINKGLLNPPPIAIKYREPADLIELIPVIRDINRWIPRQFSLMNHQVQLISDRVIIEHHFLDYRTRSTPKNSVISLSYSGDWGGDLQGNVDVPLFYSGDSMFYQSGWSRYPVGNYTMTINRGSLFNNDESFYIKARTKF